jgi:hypothetical protein
MPAPRSILIDIHDRGLNPQTAHKSVDSSGRIKVSVKEDVKPEPVPEPVVEKPKASAKTASQEESLKTEASGEATVDAVVSNEGAGSVEHSKQEEAVSETPAAPRRGKRNAPVSGT